MNFQKLLPGAINLPGVFAIIGDILVKVRGSRVKVQFWTPLLAGELAKLWKKCTAQVCRCGFTDFECVWHTISWSHWNKCLRPVRILHGFGFTSAVAAHHGPSPAFQTIILDRACPGSILKDSRHPGGGQKVFPGFLEMHHFCPANRSTHQVL
jgi:hypothetical protein